MDCVLATESHSEPTGTPPGSNDTGSSLACLTVYWKTEGDRWTSSGQTSTGLPLRSGDCAVDASIIPFGSVVSIPKIGTFLAVDTGKAVISRRAARLAGRTPEEKKAMVIDLFFASRKEAEEFTRHGPQFATITWWAPWCSDSKAQEARKLFKPEDWAQLQSLGML